MKKKILKIAIGIVAVPTVALGTLYATRNIPIVSEKVVMPLAQVSESIGLPVLVRPKISEETMRKCIGNLKYIYYVQRSCCEGTYPDSENSSLMKWLEKIGCLDYTKDGYQNIKKVNGYEGFGTDFVILLYSEDEGYNMTWREFLEAHLRVVELRVSSEEDIQRCLQLDLEEHIPMSIPEETYDPKAEKIKQEYYNILQETGINVEAKEEVEKFNKTFSYVELTYNGIKDLIDKVKSNNMNTEYYIEINEEALTDENKEYTLSWEYGGIEGRINRIIIHQKY